MKLARVFTGSGNHDLAAFKIDGYRVEATPGFSYQPCDLAVVYGVPKSRVTEGRVELRNDVHSRHRGPLLVVESSIIGRVLMPARGQWLKRLIGRHRKPYVHHPFFRLAVGGAFGPEADFNNRDSPPDRWERLSIHIQPYRTSGDHVLLIGQTPHDASLRGVDMADWLHQTALEIRRFTDRPIFVRFHPGMGDTDAALARAKLKQIRDLHISKRKVTLGENLKNAWATVALSSGAAIESLISGIPAITLSEDSLAYTVSGHDLAAIENPPELPREQWLYDLAYAQWTPNEYADGTAWRHISAAVERVSLEEERSC